jgi:Tfp pilus assembly protein PilE
MSKNRSQNILLVEIMIAVLFFALCSTVILEVFVTAKEYGRKSSVETTALIEMQDVSEQIYADADSNVPAENGFELCGEYWQKDCGEYTLKLTVAEESTEAGMMRIWQITALYGEEEVAQIPGARYIPGGEAE